MFKLFKNRQIKKKYYCLVSPFLASDEGIIEVPIYKANLGESQYITVDKIYGKKSITRYKCLYKRKKQIALLEVTPLTGRTHQIRVHMSQVLKSPIIGDFKYNFQIESIKGFNINTKKLYLHANSVSFRSCDDSTIEVTANIPNYFQKVLDIFNIRNLII